MQKVPLMYTARGAMVIALLGALIISRTLFMNHAALTVFLVGGAVVVPFMLWQKHHMEKHLDTYVLLATGSLSTFDDLKRKGPPQAFVFPMGVVALVALHFLTNIPFIWVLAASMIILQPVYKKIEERAKEM